MTRHEIPKDPKIACEAVLNAAVQRANRTVDFDPRVVSHGLMDGAVVRHDYSPDRGLVGTAVSRLDVLYGDGELEDNPYVKLGFDAKYLHEGLWSVRGVEYTSGTDLVGTSLKHAQRTPDGWTVFEKVGGDDEWVKSDLVREERSAIDRIFEDGSMVVQVAVAYLGDQGSPRYDDGHTVSEFLNFDLGLTARDIACGDQRIEAFRTILDVQYGNTVFHDLAPMAAGVQRSLAILEANKGDDVTDLVIGPRSDKGILVFNYKDACLVRTTEPQIGL